MIPATLSISAAEARRIVLSAQGLTKNAPYGSGVNAVIKAIDTLGYVQLDTLSVVERAHHHILRTRIPSYQPDWLERSQYQKREVFEFWAHAASYLPMNDFRYSLPVMGVFKTKKENWP